MRVAILGCGPSGLLATHAAAMLGHDPTVYSIAVQSEIHGAQYLHRSIPEITSEEPDARLMFRKWGFQRVYAVKLYGSPHTETSWTKFEAEHEYPAWNMSQAYDRLWKLYEGSIINRIVNAWDMPDLLNSYPEVISTIPASNLCRKSYHEFKRLVISISPDAPAAVHPNQVVYSGRVKDQWYRACDIFGHRFTEFTGPIMGEQQGFKPLSTNCDCFDGRVTKVGRYGKWTRGELIHHAFESTATALGGDRAVHTM
jgi:hypothetical protein